MMQVLLAGPSASLDSRLSMQTLLLLTPFDVSRRFGCSGACPSSAHL